MQILCTICSDIVSHTESTYVTKCGHLFHHHCLSQWISRSKTCPQCRNKVTERCMFRIFPTISSDATLEDATTLQSKLDDAQLNLRQNHAAQNELQDKLKAANEQVQHTMKLLKNNEKQLVIKESAISALKEQLDYVRIQNKETNRLKEENEILNKNMQTLNALQKVLNATSDEVEEMLQGYSDVRTIATFATALKRALCESESKKSTSRERLQTTRAQLAQERTAAAILQQSLSTLREQNESLKAELESLQQRQAQSVSSARDKRRLCEEMETAFICDSSSSTSPPSPTSPHSPPSKLRRSESAPTPNATPGEQSAMDSTDSASVKRMVGRIASADSPYLCLKQGAPLGLTLLQPTSKLKFLKKAPKSRLTENQPSNCQFSIFESKRQEASSDRCAPLEVTFDGLGGHSRLDVFPVSRRLPPPLSARHRLRPPPPKPSTHTLTITDMLNRLQNNQHS